MSTWGGVSLWREREGGGGSLVAVPCKASGVMKGSLSPSYPSQDWQLR